MEQPEGRFEAAMRALGKKLLSHSPELSRLSMRGTQGHFLREIGFLSAQSFLRASLDRRGIA